MICGYCFDKANGGTFIIKDGERIYFDSLDCLENFQKEDKMENKEKDVEK